MSDWITFLSITQKIQDIHLANVRSTFESNILQMIAISKFAVPHMKRGSAIINTTSVVAYAGAPNLGASSYCILSELSAYAIQQWTMLLQRALS